MLGPESGSERSATLLSSGPFATIRSPGRVAMSVGVALRRLGSVTSTVAGSRRRLSARLPTQTESMAARPTALGSSRTGSRRHPVRGRVDPREGVAAAERRGSTAAEREERGEPRPRSGRGRRGWRGREHAPNETGRLRDAEGVARGAHEVTTRLARSSGDFASAVRTTASIARGNRAGARPMTAVRRGDGRTAPRPSAPWKGGLLARHSKRTQPRE